MPAYLRTSIVTSVYGDLRFLDAAVDSVLQQDFHDFEFVIVDDGTGETATFNALAQRDPRIRVLVIDENIGAPSAANRGIEEARSDIIVRLDADDVCEPHRVGKLVTALEEDPSLGVVGSAVEFINEAGQVIGSQTMPLTDLEIRWTILSHNPFFHSTVAFRRSCFEAAGQYRPDQLISYDHYLWFDMLPYCRMRNLPEALTRYRLNPRGLSQTHAANWRARTHRIREALWARIGLNYDVYDDGLGHDVRIFVGGAVIPAPERRFAAYQIVLKVLRAFLATPAVSNEEVKAVRSQFAQRIVERMLGDLPQRREERLTLYRLCMSVAPRTTARHLLKETRDFIEARCSGPMLRD